MRRKKQRTTACVRPFSSAIFWTVASGAFFFFSFSAWGEDIPVLRVGSDKVSISAFEQRLAAISALQRRALGIKAEDIKRSFLEKVLVPELLGEQEAEARGLRTRPDVRLRLRDAYQSALLQSLEEEQRVSFAIGSEEIKRYVEDHPSRFKAPEGLQLWRILLASKEEAKRVIDEAQKSGTEKAWGELSRSFSLDKATSERHGDLGLVQPNGQTKVPTVAVSPLLYQAAVRVRDGEIVGEPVSEGDRYAAVWRRGTVRAQTPSVVPITPAVHRLLLRQRLETTMRTLLTALRQQHLSSFAPDAVDVVDVRTMASPASSRKTVASSSPPASGSPQPSAIRDKLRLPAAPRATCV